MGNKKSLPKPKEKTPFDILEISPESTKEEIRKAYLSMLLKYHPTRNKDSSDQKVIEIKDAYEALISGQYKPNLKLDLSLYNHDYFSKLKDNFYDSVDNFIKKLLVEEPEATYPSFKSINHKKFYDYFSKFKTQRKFCDDKIFNKEMQNQFNLKVREIIEIIKKYDSRLIKEIKKIEIKTKTKKKKNKKERVTEFNCEDCCKGFRNVNQFINHLQSKKHCEKANWSEEKRELEINKLKEIEIKESKLEIEESEDELELKIKRNEKLLEELYSERNKRKEIFEEEAMKEEEKIKEDETMKEVKIKEETKNKKVPKKRNKKEKTKAEPSTKCTICNSKFDSRNKLFLHLKETHNPTKHKKK